MGNDMYNDEQLAHAEIVQKETEDALGWWKDRALKAEAKLADKYLIEEQYEAACGDRDGLLRMVETLREWKDKLEAERDALLSRPAPPASRPMTRDEADAVEEIESAMFPAPPADEATEAVSKLRPRPPHEWHEDFGEALWFVLPIREAPYCGSPLADDWPFGEDGDDEGATWPALREGQSLVWVPVEPIARLVEALSTPAPAPSADAAREAVATDPFAIECPTCRAAVGRRCLVSIDNEWFYREGFHPERRAISAPASSPSTHALLAVKQEVKP